MASSQPEFTRSFDLSQRAATKTSSYWLLQRNTHYSLPGEPHTVVELWRLAARAYHFAKREDDKNRCRSPDPAQLATYAAKSIREHPLSSLFAASHHDHEGKVIHRTESAGLGDDMNDSALQGQISRDEEVRRQLHVENKRRRVLDTHRARLPVR